jgi:enamine deaminase RidA (YjgF/YER057c/UK114 family)
MKRATLLTGSIFASLMIAAQPIAAQQAPATPPPFVPRHIPAPNGEVILASPADENSYKTYHFSGVRRAGDFIFFSGYVAGSNEPIGPDQFEERLRKLFTALEAKLKESGASTADVVSIHSYHTFKNPVFLGTKEQHLEVFQRVRDGFFKEPYPTWTAIGIDQLYGAAALVEVELLAYAPASKK